VIGVGPRGRILNPEPEISAPAPGASPGLGVFKGSGLYDRDRKPFQERHEARIQGAERECRLEIGRGGRMEPPGRIEEIVLAFLVEIRGVSIDDALREITPLDLELARDIGLALKGGAAKAEIRNSGGTRSRYQDIPILFECCGSLHEYYMLRQG